MRKGVASSAKRGRGEGSGSFGTIFRVTFEDGIIWAAKVFERDNYAAVSEGLDTTKALQKYCPHIPAVRIQFLSLHGLG